MAGGPHAVFLLDAFNAGPDVSNWVTAGNAMNTLAGKGISVAAPAGGACSMYTNWEQDGSRQWETFLSNELPDWLAANKGLAPGGHGVVGAAQGGYRRDDAGGVPPRPVPLRRLAVGLPDPVEHHHERRDHRGPGAVRRRQHPQHVGRCHSWAGGSGTTPTCTSRCWPTTTPGCGSTARRRWTCSDPAAMIGYCDQAQGSNRTFYQHYRTVGGHNGHFDFPTGGQHDWATWGPQLGAMSGDLVATIK